MRPYLPLGAGSASPLIGQSCDVLLIIAMFLGFAALTCALAGVTFLAMRRAAGRRDEMILEEIEPEETRTGRCGICGGLGSNMEMRSGRFSNEVLRTCWRCGGSGVPPEETA